MRKFFDHSHEITVAPSTIVFTIFFLISLYFLYYIHEIVLIFLMALIVMSALHPGLRWMKRRLHLPKPIGIALMYSLIILVVVTAFAVIVPPLFSEVPNLIRSLNLPPLPANIRNFNFTVVELNDLFNQFQGSFGTIYAVVSSTFTGIFTFFTVLVLSAYLLIDRDNLYKRVAWFSRDPKYLQMGKDFIDSLEVQLGGWVRGQLLLMLVIGVLTFIGLTVLGIPFALPLALAAGLFEVLPNIGPTLSAIPGLAVGFSAGGWPTAGIVLLLYVIIQQLENHLIVPKVMQKNADVSPLVTILVILIGFKMAGVIGALLAVPIYIILRTIYGFWVKDGENQPPVNP